MGRPSGSKEVSHFAYSKNFVNRKSRVKQKKNILNHTVRNLRIDVRAITKGNAVFQKCGRLELIKMCNKINNKTKTVDSTRLYVKKC